MPPLKEQLTEVKIKTPIEQHMLGRGGLFRQENMEKRKIMSVREWAELCAKDDFRAPGIHEIGLHARGANNVAKPARRSTRKKVNTLKDEAKDSEPPGPPVKQESVDDPQPLDFTEDVLSNIIPVSGSKPVTPRSPTSHTAEASPPASDMSETKPKAKKRVVPKKEVKEAEVAERFAQDLKFLETFKPHEQWLPPGTTAADYTRKFCQALERRYWRNCGLGKPAWYGADTLGKLLRSPCSWPVIFTFFVLQDLYTPMQRRHGMWRIFPQLSLGYCPLLVRVCLALIPPIFISGCGGQHLPGMWKIWICSVSTISTLVHQSSGTRFLKAELEPSNKQ